MLELLPSARFPILIIFFSYSLVSNIRCFFGWNIWRFAYDVSLISSIFLFFFFFFFWAFVYFFACCLTPLRCISLADVFRHMQKRSTVMHPQPDDPV